MEKSVKNKANRGKHNLLNGKDSRYPGRGTAQKSNPTVRAAGSEGPAQEPRDVSPEGRTAERRSIPGKHEKY